MDTTMEEVEVDQSVSRVYANANLERPREYYEYDKLQVQWGYILFKKKKRVNDKAIN